MSERMNREQQMSPGSFTATVSAITSAFGDPTRRAVYLYVRESDNGATAAQVAEHFNLHPNVARHHLDKLSAGGYVEASVEKPYGGGAGRPSKHYRCVGPSPLEAPIVRSDDLVLSLLGNALELLPQAQAEIMAEKVGAQYGRVLATGLSGEDLEHGPSGEGRGAVASLRHLRRARCALGRGAAHLRGRCHHPAVRRMP